MAAAGSGVSFFVPGRAVPAGSKRAFAYTGRDGRTHAGVEDVSGKSGREWRAAIRLAASRCHGARAPLEEPLAVWLEFWTPRPQGHFGTRGLRPSAPAYPTTRPDLLKLGRAVEDACTGILWRDDAQLVVEILRKRFADATHPIGVTITVTALSDAVAARAAEDAPQLVLADLVPDPGAACR